MLTKYEMFFKTDTECQKTDAKNQILKNDISSNQHTEKVMKIIKKKTKEDHSGK